MVEAIRAVRKGDKKEPEPKPEPKPVAQKGNTLSEEIGAGGHVVRTAQEGVVYTKGKKDSLGNYLDKILLDAIETVKDIKSFKPGQAHALVDLAEKLLIKNESDAYVLKGYAGTGKTTMMKALIAHLKVRNELENKRTEILWAGPTHNVKNIGKKNIEGLDYKYAIDIGTVHSLFLRYKKDEVTGRFESIPGISEELESAINNGVLRNDPVIIMVDETSMVEDKILEGIDIAMEKGAKVIYLGDPGQLDPVSGENKNNPLKTNVWSNATSELTEVYRQEKGQILDFLTALRTLPVDNRAPAYPNKSNGGVQIISSDSEFKTQLLKDLKENPAQTAMLAHSNKDRKKLNILYRVATTGNTKKVNIQQPGEAQKLLHLELQSGERVQFLNNPEGKISQYGVFANGAVVTPKNVKLVHGIFDENGFVSQTKSHFVLERGTGSDAWIQAVIPASIYNADFEYIEKGEVKTVNQNFIHIHDNVDIKWYASEESTQYANNTTDFSNRVPSRLKFKPKGAEDVGTGVGMMSQPVPQALKDFDPNITSLFPIGTIGGATTVHKSQGLEYENVYVESLPTEIITTKQNKYDAKKVKENQWSLMYVGASRASKKIVLKKPKKSKPVSKGSPKYDPYSVRPDQTDPSVTVQVTPSLKEKKNREIVSHYEWTWDQIENRVRVYDDVDYELELSGGTFSEGKYDIPDKVKQQADSLRHTPGARPIGYDRSKKPSTISDEDRINYISSLFDLLEPATNGSSKIDDFLDRFVGKYIPMMVEEGKVFQYIPNVNQFFVENGGITSSNDIMAQSFVDADQVAGLKDLDSVFNKRIDRARKKATDGKIKLSSRKEVAELYSPIQQHQER